MLPSGDIVPATLVRNNKTGRVIPLVSVSPAPGMEQNYFSKLEQIYKFFYRESGTQ